MDNLLTHNRDLNQFIKRNIVSLRVSEDLFDDLAEGDQALSAVACALEREVKKDIPSTQLDRAFHYSTAIEYPFSHEPCLSSRFGDSTYAVWYGALALETTIYETAYHMMREELKIEGLDEVVYRERAVYDVNCSALLVDLTGKEPDHPALIADDYGFTQSLGRRLQGEGHPGLIAPSARHAGGGNVVVFRREALSDPKLTCYLTYAFDPRQRLLTVERQPGDVIALLGM